MNKQLWIGVVLGVALSSSGCERKNDVNKEVQELKEAQQQSPEVAQELKKELEQKKTEVVRLEEKLALAERGTTDDVARERGELKSAVQQQEQKVREEIKQAQAAAQVQSASAEQARQQLEATKPPGRVEAEVNTQRKIIPNETQIEMQQERQQVPVETQRMVERRSAGQVEQPAEPAQGTTPAAPSR